MYRATRVGPMGVDDAPDLGASAFDSAAPAGLHETARGVPDVRMQQALWGQRRGSPKRVPLAQT